MPPGAPLSACEPELPLVVVTVPDPPPFVLPELADPTATLPELPVVAAPLVLPDVVVLLAPLEEPAVATDETGVVVEDEQLWSNAATATAHRRRVTDRNFMNTPSDQYRAFVGS